MNNKLPVEIEKKFLVSGFPNAEVVSTSQSSAIYITVKPEIRLRALSRNGETRCHLTYKSAGTLTRTEIETEVGLEFTQQMFAEFGADPIQKEIRVYNDNGHEVVVARVDAGSASEFYYAEVEFDSEEEALAYQYPFDGLIADVTEDRSYKMKNYWVHTRILEG
jgi:CYTH domain-containing protein